MKVSPKFDHSKVETGRIEDRIDVYEDRVLGWFLEPARILDKESGHAGFSVLLLAISFIEGYAMFLKGKDSKGHSREFFKVGLKEMFKELETKHSQKIVDRCLDGIYEQVRCGLAHYGMTREKVSLSGDYPNPIDVVLDSDRNIIHIMINPHRLLNRVEEHLREYVRKLRNPKEDILRSNFENAWVLIHG